MKVHYNIKEGVEDFAYMADLTFQDLNRHQLDYIRTTLCSIIKHNELFTEEEKVQFGGQILIDKISAELKKANKRAKIKKKNKKKFGFIIGHYDEDGWISAYAICNSEVFYGTMEDAKHNLEFVKENDDEEDWKIFALHELDSLQENL